MDEDKIEVELHFGDGGRKRCTVEKSCLCIHVPVVAADGFGRIEFHPTTLHASDGTPIWTPQRWREQ